MRVILFFLFLTMLVLGLGACSDSTDPVTEENNDPVLYDNVIMVDEQPMLLTAINGNSYTYQLTGTVNPSPSVGSILVGKPIQAKIPGPVPLTGYLRKITSVSVPIGGIGNFITFGTVQGRFTDAIKEWKVQETVPLEIGLPENLIPGFQDYIDPGITLEKNRMTLTDVTLFDGTIGPVSIKAVMDTGYVELINPVLNYGFTIRDSTILDYHSIAALTAEFGCDLTVTASARFDYEPPPKQIWKKTNTKIAPVFFPVVHVITQTLSVGFEFHASGGVQYEVDDSKARIVSRTGMTYERENGYTEINEVTITTVYGEPTWSAWAEAEIRPYIIYRIEDKFYGVAGPNIWVKPYVSLKGDTDFIEWCVTLSIGAECGVGCSIGILDDNMWSWDSPSLFSPSIELFHHCQAIEWASSPLEAGLTVNKDPLSSRRPILLRN